MKHDLTAPRTLLLSILRATENGIRELTKYMSQAAATRTRCIHCLKETNSSELDHVFPKSWYPDTTPKTVQRWTVPSCPKCNRAFGQLEKDLFLRMIFCVDAKSEGAAGLADKALRTLGVDVEGLTDEEKHHRETLRKRIRDELIPTEQLEGKPGKVPGLGPPSGIKSPQSIPIRLDGLSMLAEKIVRGCEFKIRNRFVEDPYGIVTFLRSADIQFPEEAKHLVERFDFGPGFRFQRICVPTELNIVRYCIVIWDALYFDVVIDLKEELTRAESDYRKAEGIDVSGRPAMKIKPYLRQYQDMNDYTEENWQAEIAFDQANPAPALWTGQGYFAFGGRIPCPNCATVGFYSPRLESRRDEDRKYRVCKFCGFAQELTGYARKDSGEKPYRWIMVQCVDCSPQGRFGIYDWKVPWDTFPKKCGKCNEGMVDTKWPIDEPSHPFHKWKAEVAELLAQK